MRPSVHRPLVAMIVTATITVVALYGLPRIAGERAPLPPATTSSDCDLNQGVCRVPLGAVGNIELQITPRPLPLLQALEITLITDGFPAPESALVEFVGKTMDMGPNQSRLTRNGTNRLRGAATLPVCVTGRMRWQLQLRFAPTDTARSTTISFEFDAPQAGVK